MPHARPVHPHPARRLHKGSLRNSAALGLALIFLVLGLACVLISGIIVTGRLDAFEQGLAAANARRGANALRHDLHRMDAMLRDWAWGNDIYQYMLDNNPTYIESNITPETLRDQKLGAVILFAFDGSLRHATTPHQQGGMPGLPPKPLLTFAQRASLALRGTTRIPPADDSFGLSGFVHLDGVMWMVACRPVLDTQQSASPRGWMWMAQELDAAYLASLSQQTELHLSLVPAFPDRLPTALHALAGKAINATAPMVVADADTVWSGSLMADLQDGVPLALTVSAPRDLGSTARGIVHSGMAVVLGLGVAGFVGGLLFLDRRVMSPLASLSEHVAANIPAGRRVDMPHEGDELERLALITDWAFDAIRENERFLAEMLDALMVGVLLTDRETRAIVSINRHACQLLGRLPEDVTGKDCRTICPGDDESCPICDQCQPVTGKRTAITASGVPLDILSSVTPISRDGRDYLLVTFVDISEQECTRRMLEESEERYRAMFMNTGTPALLVNEDTSIELANNEFLRLARIEASALERQPSWTNFFHELDVPRMLGYHEGRRKKHEVPREYEARFIDAAGGMHYVTATVAMIPHSRQSVAFIHDISETKRTEARLEELAFTDALTGLPNRLRGLDTLTDMLATARLHGTALGVLLLDLDDFKLVNDSLGHAVGDTVLMEVGLRLCNALGPADALARLGGDEFIIITPAQTDAGAFEALARQVAAAFAPPFMVAHAELHLSISIGIATFPKDGDTGGQLVHCADLAMYRAKSSGRGTHRFYTPDMARKAQRRQETEAELRPAIAAGHIAPHYLPVVDLGSGRIVGAEALARWYKPDGSIVLPADFVPVAEETGLVSGIDLAVLTRACAQTRAWSDAGLGPLRISCNISVRHLQGGRLPADVRAVLESSGLPAAQLALEVTETAYMEHTDKVRAELDAVAALGVHIVLDDFGAGRSSLPYLQSLAVDLIKMDRAFVKNLPAPPSQELLRAMLGVAAGLGVTSLAEGVETAEQMTLLRSLGCAQGQGYLFSPPVPPEEFEALLRAQQEGRRFT